MSLSDAPARRRAATLFDRNFVVVAGAGTGKTALLVERALNLVAGAGIPMTEIAAITFTEKAAAELRERLARAFDDLRLLARDRTRPAGLPQDTEARRAYGWLAREAGLEAAVIEVRALAALLDLDSASVTTLHAFCADILRRHPREAAVDPGFAVDEGPFFEALFEDERERFLADELGSRAPRADIWRRALLVPRALDAIASLGAELAGFRLPAEATGSAARRPPSPRLLLGEDIRGLLETIASIRRRARGMNPDMEICLDLSTRYLEAFLERGPAAMGSVGGPWTLDEYLKKKTPAPGRRLQGCAPEELEAAAALAREIVADLARVDEETIEAIAAAAAPLASRARERLLAAGFVSFDGLLRLTRDLLAQTVDARRALGARHRAILVDEFQDTDPLQYEILFFLSEEQGPPARDAYRTRLAPGRLFIVGDPKQSIYRFRGADIEAYGRAVDHITGCGGEILTLDNSFRSPDEIVQPVNALFQAWIGPGGSNEQPPYQGIVSARGPAGDGRARVEVWTVPADGDVDERRLAEGEVIAAWVASNLERKEATGRPLLCRNVALLFRALTKVDLYAQALRRAGLPFVVEGGKNFYERPEVGDLLAFLRATANANDRAALLAVLRGPLGGVPDAELARFVSSGGRLDLAAAAEVDPGRFPGVGRALALVQSFRAAMRGKAPDEIIRAALGTTPLLVLHAALFEGAQRVANLRKLVARAEDLARRGLSLEESLRALEEEFQGQREEGESPLADETVDAIHILSVHKAKGLEYDVVFVPDIGRESQHSRPVGIAVAWVPVGTGSLGVRLPDGTTNLAWVRHARATRAHEEAEEKRVLYVACTRARERLVLVNSNLARPAPWRDALSALGYSVAGGVPPDGALLPGGAAHRRVTPPEAPAPVARVELDDRWQEAGRRFAEVAATLEGTAPPVRSPARAAHEQEEGRGAGPSQVPKAKTARDVARLAGIAMHAALQRFDLEDPASLRGLAREAVGPIIEAETRAGADLRQLVLAETDAIVEEFLRSPLPRHLADANVLGREVPILFKDDTGITWSGACDLVYRDAGGRVVVADYKTERLDGDPAIAATRHRRQMEIYLEAFRRALPGEAVRAEILFVRAGLSVAL
jgi:ATP-dependent helicase/nuclease subunit A